jgi:hypothetical protein
VDDRASFSNWYTSHHLIIYDSSSREMREATTAVYMAKKFVNEGYSGQIHILRGGFIAFSEAFPELVDNDTCVPGSTKPSALTVHDPSLPPVIGGVTIPVTDSSSVPFFANIRQNIDLVDGVGQIDVSRPSDLADDFIPRWLLTASAPEDRGRKVSGKFLNIELHEQSRMKSAYAQLAKGRPSQSVNSVSLAGIEEGGKNRYKDILPFEHARVRLRERPTGSSDYVNASYIKSPRSYKKYIATQGPLPSTMEVFTFYSFFDGADANLR